MTYNVFGGTLNLAHSFIRLPSSLPLPLIQFIMKCLGFRTYPWPTQRFSHGHSSDIFPPYWHPINWASQPMSCFLHRGMESESESPEIRVLAPESESEFLIWRRLLLQALSVSSGLLSNFVAIYLTSVQLIIQRKLCLYTIVHLNNSSFYCAPYSLIDGALQKSADTCFTAIGRLK